MLLSFLSYRSNVCPKYFKFLSKSASFTEISINKPNCAYSITAYDFDFTLLCFIYPNCSVAILLALAGDAGVAEARSSMTNNFQGKYHWYNLFMIELAKIVSFSFVLS